MIVHKEHAIRRAGYATDSQYPIKLMDIIKRYNLQELDKQVFNKKLD